jgi:hypothetical protein
MTAGGIGKKKDPLLPCTHSLAFLLNYLHTRIALAFPASTFLDPFVPEAIFLLACALMRAFNNE